jgi:methionyl-tRNA formyltransferase
VVGYGRIIPPWMLELPPLGNINVHASLLPKYRGAAPIQWAIASGENVTGVTTILLDEGLDTGNIFLQRETPIASDDTAVTIAPRLAALGADLLVETLRGLQKGALRPTPQDNSGASLAPILKKEDGLIDFRRAASEVYNRLRGFQPWPGAYTVFRGRSLKLIGARPAEPYARLSPGELLVSGERLFAGCSNDTSLELLELQPEGKKILPARSFLTGYRLQPGERLG